MRYANKRTLVTPKKKNSKGKKIAVAIIGILALCAIAVCILLPFLDDGKAPSLYDESYIYQDNALIGDWREESYDEYYYQIYSFNMDGYVTLSTYYYGIKEQTLTGKYSVSDNNLVKLVYNEGTEDEKREENRFSILDDGRLVMKTLGQNSEVELVMTKDKTKYNNDTYIFGKWSMTKDGVTTTYTFNNDYTGIVEDSNGGKDTFAYSTADGNLYWIYTITYKDTPPIFSGNILPYTYKIDGNHLTLTVTAGEQSISSTLVKE